MVNISADYVGAFLETCKGLSFLCTHLITLRYITLFLSISTLIFCFWAGLDTAGNISKLFLSFLNIGLNCYMISLFYYSRSIRSLPIRWRKTYKDHFSTFQPFEFKNLINYAEIITHKDENSLSIVEKDHEFKKLSFVVDGAASITIDNNVEVATLTKGDWISELSFITGDKTSANVVSKNIYAISWSKSQLEKIKNKKPEIFEKLNSLIAKNVCKKLIRHNKD